MTEPATKTYLEQVAPYPATEAEATAENLIRYLVARASSAQFDADGHMYRQDWELHALTCRDILTTYGLIVALKTLPPEVADEIAERIWADWRDGAQVGEWLWQWAIEVGIDPVRLRAEPYDSEPVSSPGVAP